MQEIIAGIIMGTISLVLIVAAKGVWKVTESWKHKGEAEPSNTYIIVCRCVGGVMLVVAAGLLIYGISQTR